MEAHLKNIYPDLTIRPASTVEEEARNFAKLLFSSQPFRFRFLSKRVVKALFFKRDQELFFSFQNELQVISKKVTHDRNERPLAEILIHRILAIYPFLEPRAALVVPIYDQGEWKTIAYSVERIKLVPEFFGSPLMAFGLTAPGAPSLLLFMGTALPTISGHLLSFWTDFAPGFAVGELAFQLFAKKPVQKWLEAQSQPVFFYGQSLGAALALHTVCEFHEKIKEVHAFCPPALFKRTFSKFKNDTKVVLYWHKNDIVPLVGRGFHPLWKMLFIESEQPQSPFFAHIRVVPALSPLTVKETMPTRHWWPLFTTVHFLLSIPIFCVTTTVMLLKAFSNLFIKKLSGAAT